MLKLLFKLIFLSIFFVGCSVKIAPPNKDKVESLAKLLNSMDSSLSYGTSKELARDIFKKTNSIAKDFKMTYPPQYNNFLVNMGIKKKGLCYHWADELYIYFAHKSYTPFRFHLVGANIGEYWSEHNAVVVTLDGLPLKKSILLDPWRNSGELYFSKVKDDKSYIWHYRLNREPPLKR